MLLLKTDLYYAFYITATTSRQTFWHLPPRQIATYPTPLLHRNSESDLKSGNTVQWSLLVVGEKAYNIPTALGDNQWCPEMQSRARC